MAISCDEIEGVIACVQAFVREPSFTHRSFFSDSGVATLKDAVAIADSVLVGGVYNPWSVFGDGYSQ